MKIRNYTEKLTFDEILEIFRDCKQFREDGSIDECRLRTLTREIMNEFGIPKPQPIVIWMNMVAQDCYQLVAEKAIEEGFRF
jgi:hypothetical protein